MARSKISHRVPEGALPATVDAVRAPAYKSPPKELDRFVANVIAEGFARGLPLHLVAAVAAVSEPTLVAWLAEGERDALEGKRTPAALAFVRARGAEGAHAQRMLDLVTAHAAHDWRAAAWILERRYGMVAPKAPTSPASIVPPSPNGDASRPVAIVIPADLTVEQLRALAYAPTDAPAERVDEENEGDP